MLPRNHPDRIRVSFDDHRLVANAGLLLPATLAHHLGLRELVDHHLDLGVAPGRANTGDKMLTLVASALVDGQHRLRAAVLAKWTGAWNVRVMWPSDVQNVVGLYVLLDGYQKRRTPAVMGRALGFDGLSDRVQMVVIAAAKYQNQWRPSEYSPPGACSLPPIRDNVARGHKRLDDFKKADHILNMGTTSAKARRRMMTAQVLAIMVETLAVAEDSEAEDFWTGVATNGNGVAGELRDSLIAAKPPRAGAMYTPRLVAGAWNTRTADKLRVPRPGKKLVVEGTALEIPG